MQYLATSKRESCFQIIQQHFSLKTYLACINFTLNFIAGWAKLYANDPNNEVAQRVPANHHIFVREIQFINLQRGPTVCDRRKDKVLDSLCE